MPWLGLAGSLSQIPEQKHAAKAFAARPPRLLVEDVESLALAVADGLGVAVLPRRLASRFAHLVEVEARQVGAREIGPIAPRHFWMVVHRQKVRVPKVRAVMQWLTVLGHMNAQEARERSAAS